MINKMILQGRLVRDVELNTTPAGVEVAKFTVAWSEKIKENESKLFLNCTAWRQQGVFISQYFKKGQEIIIIGTLTGRDYEDKQGNKRTAYEVTVDKAHFCGSKGDSNAQSASGYSPASGNVSIEKEPLVNDGFQPVASDDGDLPF